MLVINFIRFPALLLQILCSFFSSLSSHVQTPHLCDCPTVLDYSPLLFLAFFLRVPLSGASTGRFSGLLILSSAVSGLLMSPSKAIFSTMTLISRISFWILEFQCLLMLPICSCMALSFSNWALHNWVIIILSSRSDCFKIAEHLDVVLLFCFVSCDCMSRIFFFFVICWKLDMGFGVSGVAVHLILSGQFCLSGLVRLCTVPQYPSFCLTYCLLLGFPWDFLYRVWDLQATELLFPIILEPCWDAEHGQCSLALPISGLGLLVDLSWVLPCPCYELEEATVEYFFPLRLLRFW